MFSETDIAFLQQVKVTVLTIDPTAEVWLFGSRARGDAREDSDWDFLVLTEQIVDTKYKDSVRDPLFYLGLEQGQIISTTINNKMHWEALELTNFYRCVQEDAVVV
ncbi:MAG: nucleotidyltransferase domain-containing protein [Cytophagales bacterium]|nr:MAG: nucleotidyltransferase domain-containing protein [Cytophagales bacterium]